MFLLRVGLRVALDHVDAFDDQAVLLRHDLQHPAALAAVLARDHEDVVVLPNRCRRRDISVHCRYSTSGASEMIFMNRRSRSSRATGPNTRVPIGSP